ncbi:MAG: hypothetical protein JWQ76_3555 [Ramlibacter sp.]|nr:hypothetical protein [Ramlibacter sp.]
MPFLLGFLFRVLLFAAGLVFAASLALVFCLLLALWVVGAAWARLTGKPRSPFVVRFRAAEGFRRTYSRAQPLRRPLADVTDVEPK